jgi:hypothetical protein
MGQSAHWRWKRRRQQQSLPLGGQRSKDAFDVWPEADIEHAIGLVEHYVADVSQLEDAVPNVMDNAAGCADHDVAAAQKFIDLPPQWMPAAQANNAQTATIGELVGLAMNLRS